MPSKNAQGTINEPERDDVFVGKDIIRREVPQTIQAGSSETRTTGKVLQAIVSLNGAYLQFWQVFDNG